MLRLADTTFASPTHTIAGAALLRAQLPAAVVSAGYGVTPPVAVLISELVTIAETVRVDGRGPFDLRSDDAPFRSLSVDLSVALARLGPRLSGLMGANLAAVIDVRFKARTNGPVPWAPLLAEAEAVAERLLRPEAMVAALEDALEAGAEPDPRVAFTSVAARLNELRAVATFQGRDWDSVRHTISHHLTVRHVDEQGCAIGGMRASDAPEAEVLEGLFTAVRRPTEERSFTVWIAALAGPGADHDALGPPIVNGPVAVSRVVCGDDVAAWIQRVRHELSDAFAAQDGTVPEDVRAFGEPVRFGATVVETAEELWADLSTPPSFVARVAVSASHLDQAISEAMTALRAVYELVSPELAQSLRSDVVVWTATGGWRRPSTTARGRSVGELLAARRAAEAVSAWAGDLGRRSTRNGSPRSATAH